MSTFTSVKGATVAVGQVYADVYRAEPRMIRVVGIEKPWTDHRGTQRCAVSYEVVVESSKPSRIKSIDAARLTNPRLYQLVEGVQA